jgi:mannose-6-phosphate isomerase-like protein (cupin superfamily)
MSPQALTAPIVVRRQDAQSGNARNNPAITTAAYFSNFAAGHLVGTSIASHPAGEECGSHNHRGAVEQFMVIGGRGIIEVDGVRHEVGVEDCVVVPVGATHNLIGVSRDEPFRVVCTFVMAPGHEDDTTPWKATSA